VTAEHEWTEEDSELYRQLAAVLVPAREEQIATLLILLPFGREERFRAVELGCGEGALAFALLDCFPNASLLALDGSRSMRARTAERLGRFGARACVEPFGLASKDWLPRLQDADCVLSSLCLHHLSGADKQRLFAAVCSRLSGRGAFLIADVIEPQRPEARTLFAEAYDRITKAQSISQTGSAELFEKFITEKWNYFRLEDPSEYPSPLFDQLTWLKTAGFEVVDCFWLQAGFAIYGGYKLRTDASAHTISFEDALRCAQQALRRTSRKA
jgi:SAM-dependent methyltransferase